MARGYYTYSDTTGLNEFIQVTDSTLSSAEIQEIADAQMMTKETDYWLTLPKCIQATEEMEKTLFILGVWLYGFIDTRIEEIQDPKNNDYPTSKKELELYWKIKNYYFVQEKVEKVETV